MHRALPAYSKGSGAALSPGCERATLTPATARSGDMVRHRESSIYLRD